MTRQIREAYALSVSDLPHYKIIAFCNRIKVPHHHHDTDNLCWVWTGEKRKSRRSESAYGCFKIGGKQSPRVAAHRIAVAVFCHPLEADDDVHHLCHNTLCVNPRHLGITTPELNNQERINRQGGVLTCPRCGGGIVQDGRRWKCLNCDDKHWRQPPTDPVE